MRRLLLTLALLGAGHTLGAPVLPAQSRQPVWGLTTVQRGQVVQGRLAAGDRTELLGGGGRYIREFFYQARAGERPTVHISGDFQGSYNLSAFVYPKLQTCGGETSWGSDQFATCGLDAPLARDTEVYVMIEAERPGSFRLAVYDGVNSAAFSSGAPSREPRSSTSGLHFAAGYGAVTFQGSQGESDGWTEKGVGPSARLGLGFGPFALFAEGQMSEMAPEGDGFDQSDEYTLYHADLGSRLYLLGSGSRLRPFVQVAYGIRRIAGQAEGEDVEMEGTTLTPGAGAQLFLSSAFSVEGSYRRTSGDFTRIRRAGDEWIDVPDELLVNGPSDRISAQLVVHF